MTITLTEQEAQALVNLLDTAVKSIGLGAAEAALNIFNKLQAAANAPEAETTDD